MNKFILPLILFLTSSVSAETIVCDPIAVMHANDTNQQVTHWYLDDTTENQIKIDFDKLEIHGYLGPLDDKNSYQKYTHTIKQLDENVYVEIRKDVNFSKKLIFNEGREILVHVSATRHNLFTDTYFCTNE